LAIRGFDAIPNLGIRLPFADYLPVLREIGIKRAASDGTERVDFNLLSVPPKWLAINGNDVATWFDGHETKPGEPRLLRPSDPAMQGNDVRSVQRALAKANIPIDQDGVYSPTTAAAVARFQKQNGLNVSGVVDNATRQRLGLPADTPRQGGRN
jgi:peptidoglycan hydrolase-like protein with peptidoglycan-binding domain